MSAFEIGSVLTTGLLYGLAASPHCLAICGGIAASAPTLVGQHGCGSHARQDLTALFSLNLGRVATYTLLGLVAGAFGMTAFLSFDLVGLRTAFRVVSAGFIIWLGLSLAGFGNGMAVLRQFETAAAGAMRRLAGGRARKGRLVLAGLAWGALPCGMVYSALLMAFMTGNAFQGAVQMAGFGLATVPTLVLGGFGLRSAFGSASRIGKRRLRQAAGFGIATLGALTLAMATPGMDLIGLCL